MIFAKFVDLSGCPKAPGEGMSSSLHFDKKSELMGKWLGVWNVFTDVGPLIIF